MSTKLILSPKLARILLSNLISSLLIGVTFLLPTGVFGLSFDRPTGYLNDYENILTNDQVLEQKLANLESATGVEFFILTTKDFQGTTIEDYSNKLFESWGIGKRIKDNGLLLVISIGQKQSRFEVGYGLEGLFNDSKTGRIQDQYLIPNIKLGEYNKAVLDTLEVVQDEIYYSGEFITDNTILPVNEAQETMPIFYILFVIGIILLSASKSWWLGGILGFVFGITFGNNYIDNIGYLVLPIPLAILGVVTDFILSKIGFGNLLRILWYASSIFGGGSSRGFGGSGGGRSGGGGSSRGW